MKNLFDYATKELSQDAFLRWFFESYDDKDFGYIVADFINYFTKNKIKNENNRQLNIKIEDIQDIKTYSQKNKIDVTIDIYFKNIKGHKTIVIEDKTTSEEHNQLLDYNDSILCWTNEENESQDEFVYKVFYKTSIIGNEELNRVKGAKWSFFDIVDINNFFIKYKGVVKSEILNDYINHIEKMYNDYMIERDDDPINWNDINFDTFMRNYIKRNYSGVFEYGGFTFRNTYYSLCIYYFHLKDNNEYMKYAIFEIIKRDKLIPALHPGYNFDHEGKERWEWGLNRYPDNIKNKGSEEANELRDYVDSIDSCLIERSNTKRAFAKIKDREKINYKKISKQDLEDSLKRWLDEYKRIVEGFKNKK